MTANAVAWTGVILGLIAKITMAHHRFTAIKLLFVATVIAGVWAIHLQDWQSMVLHFISCGLMVRTLKAWKGENQNE